MVFIWDYDINELKKTEKGRLMILERMINFGPDDNEKIPLDQVKANWNKLQLHTRVKRLLELIIWDKYLTSPHNKNSSWML